MTALQKTPPAPRLTVAEFLAWPDDPSGRLWQLVDGEPVLMAPASRTHGAIQSQIARLLSEHLEARGGGCTVITNPGIVPSMCLRDNVRIPDLAVTCGPDDGTDPLVRDPVLAIEILSPSNESGTWANVWTYITIPSLREILVLHSTEVHAELLRRGAGGTWPETPEQIGPADALRLDSIGASFPLAACYTTTRLGRDLTA